MLASRIHGRRLAGLVAVLAAGAIGACGGGDQFSSGGSAGTGATDGGATGGTDGGGTDGGGTGGVAGGSGGVAGGSGGGVADATVDAPCTDADGDNVTTCAGDCDDDDRNTYPGAPEICGDGRANSCQGAPDALCGGIGTFVSAGAGSPTGAGTMIDPVDTIAHGIQNAQTILAQNPNMPITVYVAEGHYPEKITLVEGINLFGGFSCKSKSDCTWKRDPKVYDSAILDQDDEGLLAPESITRKTHVDGFRIQGHDTASPAKQPGAAAVTIGGGSPTITTNTINGPAVSASGSTSRSVGVAIAGDSSGNPIAQPGPLLIGNTIIAGQAPESSTGILLGSPRGFNFSATPPTTYAEIATNVIYGGNSNRSYGITATTSGDGTAVVGNIIGGGSAVTESWGVAFGSTILIDANRVNADANQTPTCQGSTTSWCGGIQSWSGEGVITNNIVYGADAPYSAAVRLTQTEKQAQEVVVSSNFLVAAPPVAAGAQPPTAAIVVLEDPGCNNCGTASVGRIRNNFMMPGRAGTRFGVLEAAGKQEIHPDKVENNDFWFALYGSGATDVFYRQRISGVNVDLNTLVGINQLGLALGNFAADCYDATFHLTKSAQCIDAGLSSDAPDHDFEGDPRPSQSSKYDVGPDEAQP